MNYSMLDHLEVFTSGDNGKWHEMLIEGGVLNENGILNSNKLNLMVGAFTSSLVDEMRAEESGCGMNVET